MKWYLLWWNLIIPDPLREGLQDFVQRHYEISLKPDDCQIIKEGQGHTLDYPGLISANRHLHELHLDGLTVRIPSTDFGSFFRELNDLPLREEGGIPHFRLYGTVRCLCMLPEQRESLLREMGRQLSLAVEIGDWENRVINAALGRSHTVKLRIGDAPEVEVEVFSQLSDSGFVAMPRPVLERDIEEA